MGLEIPAGLPPWLYFLALGFMAVIGLTQFGAAFLKRNREDAASGGMGLGLAALTKSIEAQQAELLELRPYRSALTLSDRMHCVDDHEWRNRETAWCGWCERHKIPVLTFDKPMRYPPTIDYLLSKHDGERG